MRTEGGRTYLGRSAVCGGVTTEGRAIGPDRAAEVSRGRIRHESAEGPNGPGKRLMGEASKVARWATIAQNRWNANYGSIGTGTAGRILNQKFGRTADTNFISDTGGFNSSYNSLQSSLLRRFSAGYFAKFTYTYSKAIGPNGNQTGVDGYSMNNPAYFKLNKALQGYDRANMFTASGGAELPFGKGKRWANNGPQRLLLGGWQLNGLFTAYSGSPFTVGADGTALNAPNNA